MGVKLKNSIRKQCRGNGGAYHGIPEAIPVHYTRTHKLYRFIIPEALARPLWAMGRLALLIPVWNGGAYHGISLHLQINFILRLCTAVCRSICNERIFAYLFVHCEHFSTHWGNGIWLLYSWSVKLLIMWFFDLREISLSFICLLVIHLQVVIILLFFRTSVQKQIL
jgi:hypothetical protein